VRADVAVTLATRPRAQIQRVIAQGRAQPGVRDLAAWVVSALRALPAEAAAPPHISDRAILFHPGISGYQRQIWLGRFRAAEPADRQAILDRFLHEVAHAAAP
jgi:hypothetical protein